MPASALKHVDFDYTLPVDENPRVLDSLTREVAETTELLVSNDRIGIETRIASDGGPAIRRRR